MHDAVGDAGDARRHVALVGLSGTGKSTVAPLLAAQLGLAVVDVDREIERSVGTTVSALFDSKGESAFRDAESIALADSLDGPVSVLATGGGAVLAPANRRLLRERAMVVWLRLDIDAIVDRLSRSTEARPLLAQDPTAALRTLADERESLYREVADVVVDVDDMSPDDVAEVVVGLLRTVPGASDALDRAVP